MSLRLQMLLAALLTLLVPLLGWQSVRELDSSLRASRAETQRLTMATLALSLPPVAPASPRDPREIRAERAPAPIVVDGYADDWAELGAPSLRVGAGSQARPDEPTNGPHSDAAGVHASAASDGLGLTVSAAVRARRLFLLVDIDDDSWAPHRPPRLRSDAGEGELPGVLDRWARGDALQLLVLSEGRAQHVVLSAIAPGALPVRVASFGRDAGDMTSRPGETVAGWQAAWNERAAGHRIELSMPLPTGEAPRLGIAVIDRDDVEPTTRTFGTVSTSAMRTRHRASSDLERDAERFPRLYLPDAGLHRQLSAAIPLGARGRLFDAHGRLLADTDRLNVGGQGDAEGEDGDVSRGDGGRAIDGPDAIDRRGADRHGGARSGPFDSLFDAFLFRVFAFLVAGDLPLSERLPTPDAAPSLAPRGIEPDAPAMRALLKTRRYVTPTLDRVLGTLMPLGAARGASATTAGPAPLPSRTSIYAGASGPDSAMRATAEPSGWLWYESNEEHSAAFTGSRLARLFSLLVLASVFASLVLLGWASWLSLRIRRIATAAAGAVSPDGRTSAPKGGSDAGLAAGRSGDELGGLARDLASLQQRSAGYERYLEALAGRLSHELRTPLSVVRTSLEHLREDDGGRTGIGSGIGEEQRLLLERAAGGADELDALLGALIRSTRLEQTLERAEIERLSIDRFLTGCRERYAQLHRDHRVTIEFDPASADEQIVIDAAPELLLQALDKLIDNAVDYAARRELILLRRLGRGRRIDQVLVAVANPGEAAALGLADPERGAHWFEPMTSERRDRDARHLGLGLHLVALVARRHGGEPIALVERGRTIVGMWLPVP